jgi:hypothetical protein
MSLIFTTVRRTGEQKKKRLVLCCRKSTPFTQPDPSIHELTKDNTWTSKRLSQYKSSSHMLHVTHNDTFYHAKPTNTSPPLPSSLIKLNLPSSTSQGTLILLLQFLSKGKYGVPLDCSQINTGSSPALLLPLKTDAQPIIKSDIEMYLLGNGLGLHSLTYHAMTRLNSHHVSSEPSFPILEVLASTSDHPQQLISWFESFLKRGSKTEPGTHRRINTNWTNIISQLGWRTALNRLPGGPVIIPLIDRVGEELQELGWESPKKPPRLYDLLQEIGYSTDSLYMGNITPSSWEDAESECEYWVHDVTTKQWSTPKMVEEGVWESDLAGTAPKIRARWFDGNWNQVLEVSY